jgi:hypothetical protein
MNKNKAAAKKNTLIRGKDQGAMNKGEEQGTASRNEYIKSIHKNNFNVEKFHKMFQFATKIFSRLTPIVSCVSFLIFFTHHSFFLH